MKPAPKYQAAMALHRLGDEGIWEHHLFGLMRRHYRESELAGLREDLVGLSTVGWLRILDQRDFRGQILRRYAMEPAARRLVEYQLDLRTCLPLDAAPAAAATGGGR
jgi:hypothetical protein